MEICIDSPESARNAIEGGAARLEACSALSEGGLTPTVGLIKQIRSYSNIPIFAMLRVRKGGFAYSREEMDTMLHDLQALKEQNVNGFVFGALTQNGEIASDLCQEILLAANPLPVTFHRAFDEVIDPISSLELLIQLGFQRILTSGQKDTAEEGLDMIMELVQKARNRIIIIPGSGITKENILKIKLRSGAKEFHASAKRKKNMPANKVKMGTDCETDFIIITDPQLVSDMVVVINSS